MTLIANISQISYNVPLTKEQWDKLNEHDFSGIVSPKLVAAGAIHRTIEYSGHYGSYIYFDVPYGVEVDDVLLVISELVD